MRLTTVASAVVLLSHILAEPCSDILTTSLPDSNITVYIATLVAAGSNFTGETLSTLPSVWTLSTRINWYLAAESYNTPLTNISAHCRIAGKVATSPTSHAGFELWMPPFEVWNKRFLATGNGGWAGAVNYPDIYFGLEQSKIRKPSSLKGKPLMLCRVRHDKHRCRAQLYQRWWVLGSWWRSKYWLVGERSMVA